MDRRLRARAREPQKFAAREIVRKALESGEMQRQPCQRCGGEPAEAHHPDYERPRAVRWLCERCHKAAHGVGKAMGKKTDNSNLDSKLALRRHYLRKYHAKNPPRVIDCCQGDGLIWKRLRDEFEVGSYFGIDKKRKKGRLKMDSVRLLAGEWAADVIDIDTYGSPWKHWRQLVKTIDHSATVFLTAGFVTVGGGGNFESGMLKAMGMDFESEVPAAFKVALMPLAIPYLLAIGGHQLSDVLEAPGSTNARYIGLRLEPVS